MNMNKLKFYLKEFFLLFATFVMLIPVFYFVISAFKLREDILFFPMKMTAEMFTLENFKVAWTRIKYFQALKNTAIITVGSLAIVLFCSSLAGFSLARIKARRFSVYYTFMISLMILPFIGCLLPLIVIMNRIKLFNNLWACILIQAGWSIPFATFLFTSFMRSLPGELEEAAMIDGCSMWRTYFQVFLPLLAPVTATVCIRTGIGIWNDYLVSATFLNNTKMPTVLVSVSKFFGEYVNEYGQSFAAVIMCSIPALILFLSLQKYFVKGIVAGSVKS